MRYDFEWDVRKAKTNVRKHKISFERATEIFRDPNALSIVDEEHSEYEERWITIGWTIVEYYCQQSTHLPISISHYVKLG